MPLNEEVANITNIENSCVVDRSLDEVDTSLEICETLTIEEAVEKAVTKINLKLVLLFAFAGSSMYNSASNTLATVFTGRSSK